MMPNNFRCAIRIKINKNRHLRWIWTCDRLAQTRLSQKVVDQQAQIRKVLQALLQREYGLVIDSTVAAKILGFRSAGALTKARNRGLLDLDMFPVPNRKGLFTSPEHLAAHLLATIPLYHLPLGGSDGRISTSGR